MQSKSLRVCLPRIWSLPIIVLIQKFPDENISKMGKVEELKHTIADGYAKLRSVGDKWDVSSKKYLEKTEEFSPLHIKVREQK